MLTPAFELTQNEEFLIVCIKVPYAKISEVEVHFEDNDFMFYSKPYYLRLNLPKNVLFCDKPSVKYDVDERTFTINVPKAVKGEIFQDLDLLTKLLAPKKKDGCVVPKIEVLEGSEEADENEEEFDWNIPQIPYKEPFGLSITKEQCGFGNSYSYSVFDLEEEAGELFELKDLEKHTRLTRWDMRKQHESILFNEDHYIADIYHDEEIQQLIKYHPEWDTLYEEIEDDASLSIDDKIHFTSEEKEKLRRLPNKEYLLDENQAKTALLGLIDILFAYAYNKRTTKGENTVMSAWAINRISATLSWLEVFTSVEDVVKTCIRRSLIYPLFRHYELSLTVVEDVVKILKLGRKYVLKCLLEIHDLFNHSEPRYILNDLYITDYSIWMQTKRCSSKKLLPLASVLDKVILPKGDIDLNLVDIESLAQFAWMSHENCASNSNSTRSRETLTGESETNHSLVTNSEERDLSSNLGRLSLDTSPENANAVETSEDEDSEYEFCSSCTSETGESSSSTFGTDSSGDSDSSSEDASDDTETSDDDADLYSCLLRPTLSSDLSGERVL